MKTKLTFVALLGPDVAVPAENHEEGVALAIIYHSSGSMKDPVPDRAGKHTPKYLVANRALEDIARQVQALPAVQHEPNARCSPKGRLRNILSSRFPFEGLCGLTPFSCD